MKKILLFLILIVSFISGFAQPGNDTTKYVYFQFQYGQKFNRVWGVDVLDLPTDTVFSKYGLARKGTTIYVGNGIKWTANTSVAANIAGTDGKALYKTSGGAFTMAMTFDSTNSAFVMDNNYKLQGKGSGLLADYTPGFISLKEYISLHRRAFLDNGSLQFIDTVNGKSAVVSNGTDGELLLSVTNSATPTTASKGITVLRDSVIFFNDSSTGKSIIKRDGQAIFQNHVTGITESTPDSSNKLASTAWVKRQTFSGGGGSGNPNSNFGSGYRWAIPLTNNIKTAHAGTGLTIDSAAHANELTFNVIPDTIVFLSPLVVNTAGDTVSCPTCGAGGTGTGNGKTVQDTITQASHGFVKGNWIAFDTASSTYVKSDLGGKRFAMGIASTIIDVNTFILTYYGDVSGLSGLTSGRYYYQDTTTSGAGTTISPVLSHFLGQAKSTTIMHVEIGSRPHNFAGGGSGSTPGIEDVLTVNQTVVNDHTVTATNHDFTWNGKQIFLHGTTSHGETRMSMEDSITSIYASASSNASVVAVTPQTILLQPKGFGSASNGYVWTLLDNSNGSGGWRAGGGGGGGGTTNGVGRDTVTTITSGTSSTVPDGTNIIRFNSTSLLTYTLTLPTNWHTSNDLIIAFTANGTIANGGDMVTLTIVNGSGHTISQMSNPNGLVWHAGETIRYHLISTIEQRVN